MTDNNQATYSLLFSGARLLFNPEVWNIYTRDWSIPWIDQKVTYHYPGFLFSTVFLMGIGTSAYILKKGLMKLTNTVMTYFKSMGNASKYLS